MQIQENKQGQYFKGDGIAFGEIGKFYQWVMPYDGNDYEWKEVSEGEYISAVNNNWISTNDRMPLNYQKVLMFGDVYGTNYQSQSLMIGFYDTCWHTDRLFMPDVLYIIVSHWMPLPQNNPSN